MANYYVHMIDDDPVLVYGPYSLKSAKDFARIGSQPGKSGGGRRAVFTGPTPASKLVRVYEEGERVWPRSVEGLGELEQAEVPRVLASKPKKGSTLKLVANPGEACEPAGKTSPLPKALKTKLLQAMRVYLGSVDYASVPTQEKFYKKVAKLVTEATKKTGVDSIEVWRQAEAAARFAGVLRPQLGKDY